MDFLLRAAYRGPEDPDGNLGTWESRIRQKDSRSGNLFPAATAGRHSGRHVRPPRRDMALRAPCSPPRLCITNARGGELRCGREPRGMAGPEQDQLLLSDPAPSPRPPRRDDAL
jgi:hypothetical protein